MSPAWGGRRCSPCRLFSAAIRERQLVDGAHIVRFGPTMSDGLRPGQLGVVLLGRVIIGDIAATLAGLAYREVLPVTGTRECAAYQRPGNPA
jgi:hypothetical protein